VGSIGTTRDDSGRARGAGTGTNSGTFSSGFGCGAGAASRRTFGGKAGSGCSVCGAWTLRSGVSIGVAGALGTAGASSGDGNEIESTLGATFSRGATSRGATA
jgi:hypothetical protein